MSSLIFWPLATVDGIAFYFLVRSWWTDSCPYCADTVDAKNVSISLFQINPEVDGKRCVQYVGSQSTNTCWTSAYPSVQSFPNWMWNAQTLAARGSVSMVLRRDIKRPAHSSFWNAPMAVLDRICEIHLSVTWRSALKRKYLASTALLRWRCVNESKGICFSLFLFTNSKMQLHMLLIKR